jgi:hypothetical protein
MIEIVTMLAIAKLRSIFPLAAHDDTQRIVRSARAQRRGADQLWANAIRTLVIRSSPAIA